MKQPPKEIKCLRCCAKAKLVATGKTRYVYRCPGCGEFWYKERKQ